MKKKRHIFRKLIPTLIILIMLFGIGTCYYLVSPVSNNSEKELFTVKKFENGYGSRDLINDLYNKGFIKNKEFTYLYVKINGFNPKVGTFELDKNMSLGKILKYLSNDKNIMKDVMRIEFKEPMDMTSFIETVTSNTSITETDIINKMNDKEYIKSLITKYWFLTDEILQDGIYYPLEGYLAPDTYEFYKDATIDDIFEKLLNQESDILDNYKILIDSNDLSIHKIMTLASIAEREANNLEDRKNVVGVFYNRLNNGIALGSDVTTYYAAKKKLWSGDLTIEEINSDNPYNTRSASSAGKLPIGPICSPVDEAINATLNYTSNNYFYFVSDKNGKLYFSETEDEHVRKVQELQESGNWHTYDE